MGKSKKIDLVALIVFGVLIVSIVMVIVGVCIAWTSSTATLLGKDSVTNRTLSEWTELNAELVKLNDKGYEGFGVMQAFSYITLALTVLTAIVFVVSKFVNVKVLKWVVVAVAVLTVISAIVLIATTYGFCGNLTNTDGGQFASTKTVPAVGAWLATIFAVLGGAAGAVGAIKK